MFPSSGLGSRVGRQTDTASVNDKHAVEAPCRTAVRRGHGGARYMVAELSAVRIATC